MSIVKRPGVVVSGMAVMDGRIFMGKRRDAAKRGGLWELPGGKVEVDSEGDLCESPYAALSREWWEELRLHVTPGDWIASTPVLDLETRFVVELYHVEITGGTIEVLDHHDVCWVDPLDAVTRMPCSPAFYLHYPAIRDWLARRS